MEYRRGRITPKYRRRGGRARLRNGAGPQEEPRTHTPQRPVEQALAPVTRHAPTGREPAGDRRGRGGRPHRARLSAAGDSSRVIERLASHTRRFVFLSAPHRTAQPFFQQPNPWLASTPRWRAGSRPPCSDGHSSDPGRSRPRRSSDGGLRSVKATSFGGPTAQPRLPSMSAMSPP
jgi:hypothetical protein